MSRQPFPRHLLYTAAPSPVCNGSCTEAGVTRSPNLCQLNLTWPTGKINPLVRVFGFQPTLGKMSQVLIVLPNMQEVQSRYGKITRYVGSSREVIDPTVVPRPNFISWVRPYCLWITPDNWPRRLTQLLLFHAHPAYTSTILSRLAMSTLHPGSLLSPMWCLYSSDPQLIFAFHLEVPKITGRVGSQWGFCSIASAKIACSRPRILQDGVYGEGTRLCWDSSWAKMMWSVSTLCVWQSQDVMLVLNYYFSQYTAVRRQRREKTVWSCNYLCSVLLAYVYY